MARPQPHQGYERQPQHFGAGALQYRFSTAVANAKTAPVYFPEMAHDFEFP